MNTATVRFTVYGDHHTEIKDKVSEGLCAYLQIDPEELERLVTYEINVERDDDVSEGLDFKADVIARIR